MKHELRIRITVIDPPAGVWMKVQKGSCELLEAEAAGDDCLRFEFPVIVDLDSGAPNFLGKFAQGPKDARFIYVNSGTSAGQTTSCWSRRAKLSLMSITTGIWWNRPFPRKMEDWKALFTEPAGTPARFVRA